MKNKLGFKIEELSKNRVKIRRLTRESKITVSIDFKARREFNIDTGLMFFNHMLESIAWRLCANIDVNYENVRWKLTHVITEDVGIVMGRAFKELLKKKMLEGVNGSGSQIVCIDEALALVSVSFEGRSNTYFDLKESLGATTERVGDMLSQDLTEFFTGFSQGAGATINIKTVSGINPHHTWESIFRAFGEALKSCFMENKFRRGTTAGVKGTLE